MISIKLEGMDSLVKILDDKSKVLIKGIDAEMAAYCLDVNRIQKTIVPVDNGTLKGSLNFKKNAVLDYKIYSGGAGSEYAPYQEFGTGGMVQIPVGLEDEAAMFKGAGIRKVNMRAQPFFYAPAFELWVKFKEKVKDMLK